MTIQEQYRQVRQQTTDFCSHLEIEDYAIQVVKFASPAKWHLAHTTWFFETFSTFKCIRAIFHGTYLGLEIFTILVLFSKNFWKK